MKAKVYLVGAGPGDENLITVKGLNCIKKADVIVYDNLVNSDLLDCAKETSEKIYAGKKINAHTLPQNDINKLLVNKAKENNIVVRLKGGDPFVFGRGGEEALELQAHNIPFEVVPGISSSIAAAAYAGIPVTHRGISTSFHVITGHEDPTKEKESVNYEALAQLEGTLVFLMGLNNLEKICSRLINYGKSLNTPVAVISKGTTPMQKIAVGTLENIQDKIQDITYPAIIMIGEVINLRKTLDWFEKTPLFGRKILVTRARHQASKLSEKIKSLGADAIEFPTIQIEPNKDKTLLKQTYNKLDAYDWIIFTSVNGVEEFFKNLKGFNKDIRTIGNAKLCAIGEATKNALQERYLNVEITPKEYIAEALIEELKQRINSEDKILILRADVARKILPQELKKIAAQIDVVPLYQTIIPEHDSQNLRKLVARADTITFASSSTVSNFMQILGKENLSLLEEKQIACIGPVTQSTAVKLGLKNIKMAKEYTIQGLVNLLLEI